MDSCTVHKSIKIIEYLESIKVKTFLIPPGFTGFVTYI